MLRVFLSTGRRTASLIWMFLRHPMLIHKTNQSGKTVIEKHETHEKLAYEIPSYKKEMKYCKSDEKYLRPVRLCETDNKDIIAMSNKLGSYNFSQREYAESVFHFVKNEIRTRSVPVLGAAETLNRGYGSCFDSTGLFITLCRCGGIKARYKIYLHQTPPEGVQQLSGVIDRKLLDSAAIMAAFYTVAEVYVEGKWIECEVDSPPELDAYWNVPIAHFGENVSTVKGWIPNDVVYFEKLPFGLLIPTNIMMKLLKGILQGLIAEATDKEYEIGREKLEKLGKKEYDKKARRQYGFLPPLE
jgi:hypothetical protein